MGLSFHGVTNRTKKPIIITAAIIAILAIGGCNYLPKPAGTPTATTSPASSPTGTEASTTSPTPIATDTSTSTASPTPSLSLSPTPSLSLSPTPSLSLSPTPSLSASPTPTSTDYACATSDQMGECGPYSNYPLISGTSSDPWVDQNVWSGDDSYQQTLYANSPGDWYVTANANTDFGGVLTYPNTGFYMTGAVDGFSSITSSFSETFPHNAQTAAWAAYDLWFNNWADEVMIQPDISANSDYDCTPVTGATFNGETWHLCVFGSERVWKPGPDDQHLNNRSSGTIDIKAMLVWMEQNGYLPAGTTWTGGSFGFEICDTGGADENFQVTGFSWTATQ
jgi:hypothetical protein